MSISTEQTDAPAHLARRIKQWARELGFSHTAIARPELPLAEAQLAQWLAQGYHGEMHYMQRHGALRARPTELVPGSLRIISVRLDYLPEPQADAQAVLADSRLGYISRYALGRDYHKLIRRRLQRLADRVDQHIGAFGYRAFCDSAPVMEKPLAAQCGHGWVGKHTNVLNREDGSWFFLGELFTDLPLPEDPPGGAHCNRCTACIDICPTGAIVAPYVLDARRCISYLTIELEGPIPEPLRRPIGNRIYGCDDCQLVCPWNRNAKVTAEPAFLARHGLAHSRLIDLFAWDEAGFHRRTEGSAIRRIGWLRWLRNIAVALGNAPGSPAVRAALQARTDHPSELVREHVHWALEQQQSAAGRTDGAD